MTSTGCAMPSATAACSSRPATCRRMRDAVAALLGDRGAPLEAGKRGREAVLAEHSWDTIAARLEEIYAAALAA